MALSNRVCNTPPLGRTASSPYRANVKPPVELVVNDYDIIIFNTRNDTAMSK